MAVFDRAIFSLLDMDKTAECESTTYCPMMQQGCISVARPGAAHGISIPEGRRAGEIRIRISPGEDQYPEHHGRPGGIFDGPGTRDHIYRASPARRARPGSLPPKPGTKTRHQISMMPVTGRWSDAMMMSRLLCAWILTRDPGGETMIRSSEKMGRNEGKVRGLFVFPNSE